MNNGSTSCSSSNEWANLPEDILFKICQQVDTRSQSDFRRRCRSVCTSWRSALSPPLPCRTQFKFPITVPYHSEFLITDLDDPTSRYEKENDRSPNDNFLVKESTYYLMSALPHLCAETSSSDSKQGWIGWIMRVNEAELGTWRLLNPIVDSQGLFDCTPPIRAAINLLDYRIEELVRSYSLVDERSGQTLSQQVVVLLSPKDNINGDFATIMAITLEGQLAFWKTGETEWQIWSEPTNYFTQITLYKGKFYAVESYDKIVYVIDPEDMTSCATIKAPTKCVLFVYFVECQGCLYYIEQRRYDCSVSMFVLNEEHSRWDSVTSIENQVLFLLQEASFVVPACDLDRDSGEGWICGVDGGVGRDFPPTSDYEGLEKLDQLSYPRYEKVLCMCELRVSDEGSHKYYRFHRLLRKDYTSIFFPPPPWIEWRCPARDNGIVSMRYLPKAYLKRRKKRKKYKCVYYFTVPGAQGP